ncbi:TatD family hydrolase [soil metagenome]
MGASALAEAPERTVSAVPPVARLIDSHAHLQTRAFAADGADVLATARVHGLVRVLVPGFDLATSEAGLAFARAQGVPTSAGIHPHVASGADEATWERIRSLAAEPEVRAIGETGLDYDRALSTETEQLANLESHLTLAYESAKPVILHCRSKPGRRDAQDALVAVLRAAGVGGVAWRERFGARPPAVLHSFSGPVDYAEAALDLGLAISFSGLVFRRGEEASATVARLVPAERLLIETDSPYLSPPGAPRRRNEPRWVAVTAAWLAEQRGMDPVVLGTGLVDAFDRFAGSDGPV